MNAPRGTRWWRTLGGRLVLSMVLIALAAVGIAGLVTRREAGLQVRTLVEQTISDRAFEPLIDPLLDRSLTGLDDAVDRVADLTDTRIIVGTGDGEVIADSAPEEIRPDLEDLAGDSEFETDDGQLYVLYSLATTSTTTQAVQSLDRLFLLAAVGAALLAAIAALVTGRRMTRPLRGLHEAVVGIEEGDLNSRAPIDGPAEIAAIGAAVNSLAGELGRSIAARQAMTSDIAHELRAPVANVMAYVEGMMDGIAEPSGADLDVVHREIVRLRSLIDDLQELALSDAGALTLHPVLVDAVDVLDRVVAAKKPAADAAGVVLHAEMGDRPCAVFGDPDRLQQVVGNLVDNAIRHTPFGGTVTVDCTVGDGRVVWTVTDTGPGIPAEHLHRVFERLHRADPSRGRHGGAGLGLAIVDALVTLHDGTITAASPPGEGATLTVTLPAADA